MKKKLTWLTVFIAPLLLLGADYQHRLLWDYDVNNLTPDMVWLFRYTNSPGLTAPVSTWPGFASVQLAQTQVLGTTNGIRTFALDYTATGSEFYFVAQVSNSFGVSSFTAVAGPKPPAFLLRIQ